MPPRRETPYVMVQQLRAGHYREGAGYHVWRPRGTNNWLLVHTLAGRGRFGHSAGEVTAEAGDLVLVRPRTPHDYGIADGVARWELLWAHFHPRPHWVAWLNWPEEAPGILRLRLQQQGDGRVRSAVTRTFRDVHRLVSGAHRRREDLAMHALEGLLLECDASNPRSAAGRLDERVQAVMDHVHVHLAAPLSMEVLSRVSSLSVSRLAHLFRDQVGLTPQQFVESQRLARAAQLLEFTPRSVESIAREVGFENPFYFTRRFKRHAGVSPRDFRRKLRSSLSSS